MIKGHTKIELTDIKTGDVEVIESDNLFTNSFKNGFFNALGTPPEFNYIGGDFDSSGSGYIKNFPYKLFGGLLCFEEALVEDADLTNIDFANHLTARGCDFSYTGDETTLGSFSVTESGFTEDGGYKMVWNFDEAHGNGKISAVGLVSPLCSRVIGNETSDTTSISYNSDEDSSTYNPKDLSVRVNLRLGSIFPDLYTAYYSQSSDKRNYNQYYYMNNSSQIIYLNGNKDEMYILARGPFSFYKDSSYSKGEFVRDCGYIRINKFRMPYKKVSILDGFLAKYLGDVTITIPDVIMTKLNTSTSSYLSGGIWSDNGFMYFLLHPTSSIAVNETFYILKVNVSDFSTEVITMKNTYTAPINLWSISGSSGWNTVNCSGNNEYFLYADTSNKKFVRISLNDNTDIAVLKKNGEEFVFSSYSYIQYDGFNFIVATQSGGQTPNYVLNLKEKGNEVHYLGLYYASNLCVTAEYDSLRVVPIYEEVNGQKQVRSMFLCKAYRNGISNWLNTNLEGVGNVKAFANSSYGSNMYMMIIRHYNNLFTINNLGASVLKTASQSMKVTYTLTEVEGV